MIPDVRNSKPESGSDQLCLNTDSHFNHLMLEQLRCDLGLSVGELAERSQLPEAVITAAELGRPISPDILVPLAAGLSTAEQTIFPEDLLSWPIRHAEEYVHAWYTFRENAVQHMRYFFDDDIVFRVDGDPALIPFAGEHRGIEVVDQMFRVFFSVLQVPPDHDYRPCFRYSAHGTNAIILGNSWIHPIGQPMEQPMPICILMRFRRGKLYLLEDNYDTQRASQMFTNQP